ncbi:MAG: alpha/beta fold hydrolase [Actinomycetota bacterium]|nr:alpha/beta fold hydrolase [Actinomycetota bacterium]
MNSNPGEAPPGYQTVGGDAVRPRLLAMIPATERTWELAGVSTAVLAGGSGPPIVILHGGGQFAATWTRVISQLVTGHRVIVPDLPGHGASHVQQGVLDADRVLAWVGELLEATCPSPPVLLGHSLGGAIAARFATDHGARISSLVLVDTFGLSKFRPARPLALAMVGFLVEPTEHTRDRFLGQRMLDLSRARTDMGEAWELIAAYALECARSPSVRAAGRNLMKGFGVSAIPAEDLQRIAVPTTLIWGGDDLQVPPLVAEGARARYGWPLHVIDDCGADPHIEQPEALLEALSDTTVDRWP